MSTDFSLPKFFPKVRNIHDNTHDYIEIPEYVQIFIDTPTFQRLRRLHQLGCAYWIYPGATHKRFEHSIGVMHLAKTLLEFIEQAQPYLNIKYFEKFAVITAGLLHDIGHGPYSHLFESAILPRINPNIKFKHEFMSVKIVKELFKEVKPKIELLQTDKYDTIVELVCALINPSQFPNVKKRYADNERGWLFDIISNSESGIDVDKWDYIVRDSKCSGFKVRFSYDRIIRSARVVKNKICYAPKNSMDICNLFLDRWALYKGVYTHKTVKSIELLLSDIIYYANGILKVESKLNDVKEYLTLDDDIISLIRYYPLNLIKGMEQEKKNFMYARQLINRLDRRELYPCCGHILRSPHEFKRRDSKLLTPEMYQNMLKHLNKPNNISKENQENIIETKLNDFSDNDTTINIITLSQPSQKKKKHRINYRLLETNWHEQLYQEIKLKNNKAKKEDIVVLIFDNHYGFRTQNPMEKFNVYDSPNNCSQLDISQFTNTIPPDKYIDIIARCYTRDAQLKDDLKYAWAKLFGSDPGGTYLSPKRTSNRNKLNGKMTTNGVFHDDDNDSHVIKKKLNF